MLISVLDSLAVADPFDRYFQSGFRSPLEDKLRTKRVRIPKGTLIHSLHPKDPEEWFPLKRATVITVFRSARGHVVEPYYARRQPDLGRSYHEAELTWPGTGGYWKRVKLRDIEILDDIDGVPPVTQEEIKHFDDYLAATFLSPGQVGL